MDGNQNKTIRCCTLALMLVVAGTGAVVGQGYRDDASAMYPGGANAPSASPYANYELDLMQLAEQKRASEQNVQQAALGEVRHASHQAAVEQDLPGEIRDEYNAAGTDGAGIAYASEIAPTNSDAPIAPATFEQIVEPAGNSGPRRLKAVRENEAPLTYREPAVPEPVNFGAMISRLVLGTATVLGACVLCLMLAKQWLPASSGVHKPSGTMRVVASLALPHKSYLQLVEVNDRQVIVAGNASGVQTIVPLTQSFQDAWRPDESFAGLAHELSAEPDDDAEAASEPAVHYSAALRAVFLGRSASRESEKA